MNTYDINFTLFSKNTPSLHFSNCRAEISGDTYEEALSKFKAEQFEEGYLVGFVVQGKERYHLDILDYIELD